VRQARGDLDGAFAVLDEAETFGHDRHVAQSAERLSLARVRLWLTATPANVAAATRWASAHVEAWQAHADETLDYVGLLERLTLARLRLLQGQHAAAAALLRRLLERAEVGGLRGCVLEILALQARLYREGGDEARAMLALSRALELAEPEGYVRLFVDEGAPMVALLRQAQARGLTPAYVAALLAACGDAAPEPSAAALRVDPLSARERELLRLLAAGLSTSEIAAHLFITADTVRSHLKNIYGKLDVHSRLQAVERARALGLLS
jgi:LuxR family maltose regulon positive regulatory protein